MQGMRQNQRNSILVFVLWFGDLPPYFPLFLETVKRNPSIDFRFITDAEIDTGGAPNISVQQITFAS